MNLLADENVDSAVVERLRKDCHTVWYVAEMKPGISDDAVLDLANRENALLLTADKDFGELIFRQKRISEGVILLRLAGISVNQKADTLSRAIRQHAAELANAFSVISPKAIRIRHRQD